MICECLSNYECKNEKEKVDLISLLNKMNKKTNNNLIIFFKYIFCIENI